MINREGKLGFFNFIYFFPESFLSKGQLKDHKKGKKDSIIGQNTVLYRLHCLHFFKVTKLYENAWIFIFFLMHFDIKM